ncbi:hypothetical protein AA313_de0208241 [Arthrobotrys entomopaga]|nr:hypothetical protein AA313_de0208241 [Arthrobotrys entomopaga]
MMETYHGLVRTPMDAIILFEACEQGLLPRVQRRLSEKERQSIKSGSIFVWDEREAGMRRWTDGKSWSASRVSGSFLCYREMEGKRGGGPTFPSMAPTQNGKSPENGSDSDSDGRDRLAEGYRYKPDGLMKQSFSITTSTNRKLHLISYYARSQNMDGLKPPSADPQLNHIVPRPGMYPEQTLLDPNTQQQVPAQPPNMPSAPGGMPVGAPRSMLPSPFSASQTPNQAHIPPDMQPPQLPAVNNLQAFNSHSPHAPSPYGWPPSPISTPPTNFQANHAYGSPSLPAPLTSPPAANTAVTKSPYESSVSAPGGYPMMGSPMHYEQTHPTLQPLQSPLPHRPSIASSIHLQAPPHSSPRLANFRHSPLPLLPPENSQYSSPASSAAASYPSRTPPRAEPWEPQTANFTQEALGASLDVQDIPNEKLGFGEDARALRQLDKTFMRV